MKTEVERLLSKGKVDGLVYIMNNSHDWMKQLDAAEALIKLHDPCGQEFLNESLKSKNSNIREVVREILEGLNLKTTKSSHKKSYAGAGQYLVTRQYKRMKFVKKLLAGIGLAVAGFLLGAIVSSLVIFWFFNTFGTFSETGPLMVLYCSPIIGVLTAGYFLYKWWHKNSLRR